MKPLGFLLLLLFLSIPVHWGEGAEAGLKVGAKAPNFALPDQSGKDQTLAGFLAKGPVALVFYRSAVW